MIEVLIFISNILFFFSLLETTCQIIDYFFIFFFSIRNLVKSFYSAGLLFDVLNFFGELSEDVL